MAVICHERNNRRSVEIFLGDAIAKEELTCAELH